MDGCGWQILHSLVLPSAGFRNQFGSFDQGQMSCLYGLKLPCFFESIRMHLYCSIQTQTPIRLLQVVIVGLGLTYVNRKRKRIAVEEAHRDFIRFSELCLRLFTVAGHAAVLLECLIFLGHFN